jgi:hypothetical protein
VFALFLEDHYGFAMTLFGYPMLALGFSLLIVAALSERSLLRPPASRRRQPGAVVVCDLPDAQAVCILLAGPLAARGFGPVGAGDRRSLAARCCRDGCHKLVETPFMSCASATCRRTARAGRASAQPR